MIAWLTGFGAAPAVAICCGLRSRKDILRAPVWTLIAAAYGAIAFAIGPVTGTWVDRLVGYGWPLFLIATPYFLERAWNWERTTVATLLGCHVALIAINLATPSLFARVAYLSGDERAAIGAFVSLAALVLQISAYRTVAREAFDTSSATLLAQN
jgi:hypothetical protein